MTAGPYRPFLRVLRILAQFLNAQGAQQPFQAEAACLCAGPGDQYDPGPEMQTRRSWLKSSISLPFTTALSRPIPTQSAARR